MSTTIHEAEPPRIARRREPLFALLLGNALWGAALGVAFVVGTLALDLGHLRGLMLGSPDGYIALALLLVGSIITFASVAMGGAIMLIPREDGKGGGPRRGLPVHLAPALVRKPAARRAR